MITLLVSTAPQASATGTTWQNVFAPGSGLEAIACPSASECFALGVDGTSIESFDGSRFSDVAVTLPANEYLKGISCVSTTRCFAVGSGGGSAYDLPVVYGYDGTSWSEVTIAGLAAGVLAGISCTTTICLAVGYETLNYALELDVATDTWTAVPPLNPPTTSGGYDQLFSVWCAPGTAVTCVAAGLVRPSAIAGEQNLIEEWNGTGWSMMTISDPYSVNTLAGISCLTTVDCYAVGYGSTLGSYNGSTLFSWDGTSWSLVRAGTVQAASLYGISCQVQCEAVGNLYRPVGSSAENEPYALTITSPTGVTPDTIPAQVGSSSILNAVDCTPAQQCVAVGSSDFFGLALSNGPGPFPPGVGEVTPSSGVGGDTSVTIDGSGFSGATAVDFGAVPAWRFTVVSDRVITAGIPSGGGVVDVTVTTPHGTTETGQAIDQFTYQVQPVVSSVVPSSGVTSGGQAIHILGTGFTGATSVSFGTVEVAASSFTSQTDTEIVLPSPAVATAGVVNVSVTNAAGSSAPSPPDQFTYTTGSPLVIVGVTPNVGADTGGDEVVIAGGGFTGATQVSFTFDPGNPSRCIDGQCPPIAATSFVVVSDAQIDAFLPAVGTDGTYDLTVTREAESATVRQGFTFVNANPPQITGVTPSGGPAAGGTTVTITGSGFLGASSVDFSSSTLDHNFGSATSIDVVSDSEITAVTPPGAAGITADIIITTPFGISTPAPADQFSYATGQLPVVASVSPSTGSTSGGLAVAITGSGFTGATAVSFGTVAATSFTVVSDTEIDITVPQWGGNSPVDVEVTTAAGTSLPSAGDLFTYQAPGTPGFTFTSSPSTWVVGVPVTFTASLSPDVAGDPVPTGTVTFSVGGGPSTVVAVGTSGNAVFTYTFASATSQAAVQAVYSGDGFYSGGAAAAGQPVVTAAPDLTPSVTHSDPFTAGSTGVYNVIVSNVGTGPTTATVTVTATLPAGITYQSADSGWTCAPQAPDPTQLDCTSTSPIAAGSHTALDVTVAVATTSPGGTDTWTVSTTGDANSANDTTSEQTSVTSPVTSAAVAVGFSGIHTVVAGGTVDMGVTIQNTGAASLPTGTVVDALVPDGNPVGQVLSATPSGTGWTCTAYTVSGRTIDRCLLTSPVAAHQSANLSFALRAPATAAGAHDTLLFSIARPGGVALVPRTSWNLVVTTPSAPVLAASLRGASTLASTPTPYVVSVANPGSAPTAGHAQVSLLAPTGVAVASASGAGWLCQVSPASLTCTTVAQLYTHAAAGPLVVGLTGTPTLLGTANLVAEVSDTAGIETAVAPLTVTLPALAPPNVTTTLAVAGTGATGTLTVHNSGSVATGNGPVTVVQTLPAGVSATVTGTGWNCQQASTTLTCSVTTSAGFLAAGASAPVATETFGGATGQAGGAVQVGTQSGYRFPGGTPARSPAAVTTVNLPLPPPPSLSTTLSASSSPVPPGGSTSITLAVRNTGTGSTVTPVTVALVLPPGTTPGAPPVISPLMVLPPPGRVAFTGTPIGTAPAFTCAPPTTAGVVVCVDTSPIAAQSTASIAIPVNFTNAANGAELFTGGSLDTSGCSSYTTCVAAADTALSGGGAGALGNVSTLPVPVTGLSADAGPAQTVDGASEGPNNQSVPTVVTLDGRGSSDPGTPVTYGWVQTAGPAVTWAASAPGSAPGTGSSLPSYPSGTPEAPLIAGIGAYGAQPTFTLPLAEQNTTQALTFELLTTDGSEIKTATTTVTVLPPPSPPPTPPALCFRPLPTGGATLASTACLAPGTVPAPDAVLVVGPADTTTPTRDAANHALLYTWSVSDPAGLNLLQGSYFGAGGDYHVIVWPAGLAQMTMTAAVTNGQLDGQGHQEIVADPVSLGTAPPALSISVSPPPGPVAAGSTVNLTANLANASVGAQTTALTWTQTAGPSVTAATSSGTAFSFTAPAPTSQAATVTFQVTGLRGTGPGASAALATVTVALVAATPLSLTVNGATLQVGGGGTVSFTVTAAGGRSSSYTYSGSVSGGGGSLTNSGNSFTYTAGSASGLTELSVSVSDAAGESTSATVPVTVGTPPSSSGSGCAATGLLTQAIAALSGGKDPTVSVAGFTFDLGLAETSPAAGSCGTGVTSLTFDAGKAALGPFTLANAKVTVTTTDLTVASGSLTAPAAWGLGTATVSTPIDINLAAATVTGGFTWTSGFPWLGSGGFISNPSATLSLSGAEVLTLAAKATVAGGAATLKATVPMAGTGFTVTVAVTGAQALGLNASGTGTLTVGSAGVTGQVALSLSTTQPVVLAGDVYLTSAGATLTWSPSGLTVAASAWIGGTDGSHGGIAQVNLAGAYTDSSDWSLTVTLAHLSLPSWLPNVSVSGASTAAGSVTDAGSTITFDIRANLVGSWGIGPTVSGSTQLIDVTNLTAELSNGPPPAQCSSLSGVWLAVGGSATVQIPVSGAPPATFTTEACAAPGSDTFSLVSTANFAHWAPIPNVPVTLDGASLNLQYANGNVSFTVGATASVKGVQGNAVLSLLPGGGVLIGVSIPNLSGLGVPLPAGAVIFSTATVADLSTVAGLPAALGVSAAALSGLEVAQDGLLAMADFQIPTSLTSVLQSANLPAPSDLTLSVDLDASGIPVITGKLAFGANGYTIFQSCAPGTAGCNPTRLALASVNLQLSLAGAFGLGATAAITLPTPGSDPTASSTIDLTAEVTIDLVAQSITASFYTTGNLVNAFGITGLTLGNLAIQGGIVFNPPPAPPTPSIGFAATIQTIPCSWAATIGDHEDGCTGSGGTPIFDANAEPMAIAVNISEKAPVFALQIGVPNNNPVLQFGSALTVDDASLVIAPLGGQIGNYIYPIGFSLRFDGQVMGTKVAVQAAVDPLAASVTAKVQVGTANLGIVTLDSTEFDFKADPTDGIDLSFTGGLNLGGDGTLTATASASVSPSGIASGQLPSFSLTASAANLNFGSALTINQFNLTASGQLGSASTPVPQLQLEASGQATVLQHTLALSGGIDLTPGLGVTGASLYANPGPITFGPGGATISGPGCTSIALLDFPGPCVGAAFDPLSSNPLTVTLDGTASANGIVATFDGTVDNTGLTLTNASVTLGSPSDDIDATVAVSGHLYFGTGLGGVKVVDPSGQSVQVQQGDFDLTGSSQLSVAGIAVFVNVNVGHLGSEIFASGQGDVTAAGAYASIGGNFSDDSGSLQYSLSANGDIVGIGGYDVVSASLTLSNATQGQLDIAGSFNLGPIASANFKGWFYTDASGQDVFDVAGSGSASIAGVNVGGQVEISDVNPSGGVSATVSLNGNWDSDISFVAAASFDTYGDFCTSGTASVGSVSGTASYCSPDPQSGDPGSIGLSFTYAGVTATGSAAGEGWDVSIGSQNPGSFDLPGAAGPFSAEVSANWSWSLDVNENSGVTLSAQGKGTAQGCVSYLLGSTCASVGATISGTVASDGSSQACASGTVVNTTVEVCADDTGIYFTQPSSLT